MSPKMSKNIRLLPKVILCRVPIAIIANMLMICGEYGKRLGQWIDYKVPGLER